MSASFLWIALRRGGKRISPGLAFALALLPAYQNAPAATAIVDLNSAGEFAVLAAAGNHQYGTDHPFVETWGHFPPRPSRASEASR